LKEKALNHTPWRTHCKRGYRSVARQTK